MRRTLFALAVLLVTLGGSIMLCRATYALHLPDDHQFVALALYCVLGGLACPR